MREKLPYLRWFSECGREGAGSEKILGKSIQMEVTAGIFKKQSRA